MNYYLFLDDYRKPRDVTWVKLPENVDWEIAKDYHDFVYFIRKYGIPHFVSYDHDLADSHYNRTTNIDYSSYKEKTGYSCANYLIEQCIDKNVEHPNYAVHSMNPTGKLNIISLINCYNNQFNDV